MADVAGDQRASPARTVRPDLIIMSSHFDIGTTGAVTVGADSDPNITLTRTGAGLYTVAFPLCPSASDGSQMIPTVISPAQTVVGITVLTFNAQTGAATIECSNEAAAATDPASGDDIKLAFFLYPSPA